MVFAQKEHFANEPRQPTAHPHLEKGETCIKTHKEELAIEIFNMTKRRMRIRQNPCYADIGFDVISENTATMDNMTSILTGEASDFLASSSGGNRRNGHSTIHVPAAYHVHYMESSLGVKITKTVLRRKDGGFNSAARESIFKHQSGQGHSASTTVYTRHEK